MRGPTARLPIEWIRLLPRQFRNSVYSHNENPYWGGHIRKFFISYTAKDSQKAQWIGWTLTDLGHQAFVHEWEIGAGQSIADWMESKVDESDHVIGVFSPD